jgi:hypothetical protein
MEAIGSSGAPRSIARAGAEAGRGLSSQAGDQDALETIGRRDLRDAHVVELGGGELANLTCVMRVHRQVSRSDASRTMTPDRGRLCFETDLRASPG